MKVVEEDTGVAITGEDTPFYFWKKEVVERIYNMLPNIKLIGIFRNPVDRAYSNYNLGVRMNTEQLGFEEAVGEEIEFMKKHSLRDTIDRKRSYISKGIYAEQIKLWLDVFPREQIHPRKITVMKKALFVGLGSIGQRHLRNLRYLMGDTIEIFAYREKRSVPMLNNQQKIVEGGSISKTYKVLRMRFSI